MALARSLVPCDEASGELKCSGWRRAQMPTPVLACMALTSVLRLGCPGQFTVDKQGLVVSVVEGGNIDTA